MDYNIEKIERPRFHITLELDVIELRHLEAALDSWTNDSEEEQASMMGLFEQQYSSLVASNLAHTVARIREQTYDE